MLATAANENSKFWSQIHKAIDAARGGEEVRIFIIGSIFGGTGASGFPNIARKICKMILSLDEIPEELLFLIFL